jgi:hypothetical protein
VLVGSTQLLGLPSCCARARKLLARLLCAGSVLGSLCAPTGLSCFCLLSLLLVHACTVVPTCWPPLVSVSGEHGVGRAPARCCASWCAACVHVSPAATAGQCFLSV